MNFLFNPKKPYAEEDFTSLDKPPMVASNNKASDIEDLINLYLENGYQKFSMNEK